MPPGPGCGQQDRQPRADQVFPVQLADPVVACRNPVEGLRGGPRRWRQMAVRLARVRGGSAPAAQARKGSAARMWGTNPRREFGRACWQAGLSDPHLVEQGSVLRGILVVPDPGGDECDGFFVEDRDPW